MARTYASKYVVVVMGGIPLTGYADGDFLTVTPNADVATKQVGADGAVTVSISPDKSGRATLRLQQTSPSNTTMQAFCTAFKSTGAKVPFYVQDLFGTTIVSADEAWIATQAEAAFGVESGQREWSVDLAEVNWALGGNV